MGYKTKFDGNTDKTIQVGGKNSSGEPNPTSLEGYFLGTKATESDYGPGKLHIFQTKEGTVGVWGKTRLDNLLTSDLLGQMVLVSFTGMIAPTKKGRKPSYGYKVQHDEENTIEVGNLNLNATSNESSDDSEEDNDSGSAFDGSDEESTSFASVTPPKKAAVPPTATQQNRVKELLSRTRA